MALYLVGSEERAVCYKLLNPDETINVERYRQQFIEFEEAIAEKCPKFPT